MVFRTALLDSCCRTDQVAKEFYWPVLNKTYEICNIPTEADDRWMPNRILCSCVYSGCFLIMLLNRNQTLLFVFA